VMIASARGGILGALDELNMCDDIYEVLMEVDRTERFNGVRLHEECEMYSIGCSDGVDIIASREGGNARLKIFYNGLSDKENAIVIGCVTWSGALDLQSRAVNYIEECTGVEV